MKKITIVTMQLKTPGGIERFVSTLATMFAKDYEVEIIVNYGRPSDKLAFELPKNVKLTFLSPSQPAEISMKNLIFDFKWHRIPGELKRRFKINFERKKNLNRALKNLNTNYIITERALYSSLVGKFYRGEAVKIATDHNFRPDDKKYMKNLTRSLKKHDFLVVATKELQKLYQGKIGDTKCVYIPNPLPNIPTRKAKLNTKNLLAVGRFVPEKDFSFLIDAMKIIHDKDPEVHLTLIGDGPEKAKIKAQVKESGLLRAVSLPGALLQTAIEPFYYNSSLFVMTSKTEAFGLVLTEAMAHGLPCIALKRASGARAQINVKNGVLCNNMDEFTEEILELINNRTRLLEFQKNIETDVAKYSLNAVLTDWEKIL